MATIVVGNTNKLSSTLDITAKTLTIAGCTAFDLTLSDLNYIWSSTQSKTLSVKPAISCVRSWVAGSPLFTYTFESIQSAIANGDTLLVYLQVPQEFMDFLVLQKIALP
jgi:hypothetical protein